MKYNYEFDMKYTDNPYIDLIVNCVKILGMNAVVKNENQALHYEDKRSAKAANDYFKFKEGLWNKDYDYHEYMYTEWNSYYRMLNGLPPLYTLAEEKEFLDLNAIGVYDLNELYVETPEGTFLRGLYDRYFIDMGQYEVPADMPSLTLEGRYLHQLSNEEISMIESCGIMAQIIAQYAEDPHYQYIYHLGYKKIDFYTARKALNYTLLWVPELNTFDIIENKFKRVYERNRKYTMSAIYSEAYRFMSYHYDAFIQILIIIQTMVDMISEVQEYIINKDVFDSRTIRYLFESYGIAYYKEIPVKYQIRIIKNVNNLLKYKSSNKNIMDILELFDDDTITVFTYYIMKTKKINRDDFFYYSEEDINPKFNTNRRYWLGNPNDISNGKVPLTDVKYNITDYKFASKYIYEYDGNDIVSSPIIKLICKELDNVETETLPNSFISSFLDNPSVRWFGVSRYNVNTDMSKYLINRNEFLTRFKNILVDRLRRYLNNDDVATNRYWYKKIKYEIYVMLGVADPELLTDFYSKTDSEIESYFYQEDTLLTDRYRQEHGIDAKDAYGNYIYFREDSEDRFMLNHSIPYMVLFEYKTRNTPAEEIENYSNPDVQKSYIFNNPNSFSVTINTYPESYVRWTKEFRKNYLTAIRSIVERVFEDFIIDPIENPSPRYIGWMDLNYVISQLRKPSDEFQLGDEVTTVNMTNIPIYSASYIYEVVTEDMIGKEDYRKNYNLSFLKVPILDPNAYKILDKFDARRGYDSITLADPFWDGVSTYDLLSEEDRMSLHESKKQDILAQDFTIERTKYIAVEASIDLTKMAHQYCYFMNMLFDKHFDEENVTVEVDSELSRNKVKLNDLICFAIALNYLYQGVEPDNIGNDMEKNMYINGFNFDNDWPEIYDYLQNHYAIYANYENEEKTDYTYTDEYGKTHEVHEGYGMAPLEQGWMTELYESWYVYTPDIKEYTGSPDGPLREKGDPKIGAFLSGRYEQCSSNCATTEKMEMDFGHSDIWVYNLENFPNYNPETKELETIDISWKPTQYPADDNNSHGLWMLTEILNNMTDATDLEKINMLKKIYYSNTNLYDHLVYMMNHAETKRMHDIYKIVFESFMETKMNHDFYKLKMSDGSYVYTDVNSEGSIYSIVEDYIINTDSNGFPFVKGTKYDVNNIPIGDEICEFHYNADFTDCYYQGETITADCIYDTLLYQRTGTKEYIVHLDEGGKIGKNYLFPQTIINQDGSSVYFDLDRSSVTYLVNKNDTRIKVPVNIDNDGVATPIVGVFGNIIVEKVDEDPESRQYKITIMNGEEIELEVIVDIEQKVASDYYEFLQYRNTDLYKLLVDIKYNYGNTYDPATDSYKPSDEKRQRIEALCELVAMALERYFSKDEWRLLFNIIPTSNIQNIQSYIMKMVLFFKSWKTQLVDTSITYLLNDMYGNYVQVLDDMYKSTYYNFKEKVRAKDFKYSCNKVKYNDPVRMSDSIDINCIYAEPYWVTFGFGEKMYGRNFDFPEFVSNLNFNDSGSPRDKVTMKDIAFEGEITIIDKGNGMKVYLLPEEVQPNEE